MSVIRRIVAVVVALALGAGIGVGVRRLVDDDDGNSKPAAISNPVRSTCAGSEFA